MNLSSEKIEQLTEEVVDFAVHLLTCLYLFSQLVPFDTSELIRSSIAEKRLFENTGELPDRFHG
jgi:hypothetical protein